MLSFRTNYFRLTNLIRESKIKWNNRRKWKWWRRKQEISRL